MDLHLTNKLTLTTGSTKGIGKVITIGMIREGTGVIINGRSEAEATKVVREIQTMFPDTHPQAETADISTESRRATLFEKSPKVDILMSNVGVFEPMEYWDINDATWEKFFTVNALSGNALTKAYLPKMFAQDFGRIIFIASEEAMIPSGEIPQCSMTKTMNLPLAKSLSNLTVDTCVTVSTVMPGSTFTKGVEESLEDMYADSNIPKEDWERDFMKNHRSRSQARRLIRPEEIGCFATSVTSPDSSLFSDEALRIGGGLVSTIF